VNVFRVAMIQTMKSVVFPTFKCSLANAGNKIGSELSTG